MTGKVKWWDDRKGFGFISTSDGREAFVHHTDVTGNGRKTLTENQRVEFSVIVNDKGLRATNVIS